MYQKVLKMVHDCTMPISSGLVHNRTRIFLVHLIFFFFFVGGSTVEVAFFFFGRFLHLDLPCFVALVRTTSLEVGQWLLLMNDVEGRGS